MTTEIVEYHPTEAALTELADRFKGVVYDVTTEQGLTEATQGRNELRKLRTGLEAKRKELKAPALERSRLIDDEAKTITARILALETPIAEQIEKEAARQGEIKAAEIAKETARKAGIEVKLQGIITAPQLALSQRMTNAQIELGIEGLENDNLEWAQERTPEAMAATQNAVAAMRGLAIAAKAQEETERELAELRAKQAAELEATKAALSKAEAEAKARDAREAAEKAEREKVERQREADAAAQAEGIRRAAEAKAKAESDAREAVAKAERDRLDAIAKAEREAAAAEAAAERERIRKQQEALDAERRDIERERNEVADAAEMLQAFVNRFGHRKEFRDIVAAIEAHQTRKAA